MAAPPDVRVSTNKRIGQNRMGRANRTVELEEAADALVSQHRDRSLDRAYAYCARLATSHYENFPVGSLLIPRRLRKHFFAIYSFARTADDFADEPQGADSRAETRLARISEWGALLEDSFAGRATHPIFIALADTASRFNLPIELFRDLLAAFTRDVVRPRYETFDELLDYCRLSANPVGRLILLMFGYTDGTRHHQSDAICTALQLTNHWQDVALDLDRGRVYLPEQDLRAFGLTVEDIERRTRSEAFANLLAFEVARARDSFLAGKPLCLSVPGRPGLELRAIWLGGWRILDLIEQNDYDVFARRPALGRLDKLRIVTTALRRKAFERHQ